MSNTIELPYKKIYIYFPHYQQIRKQSENLCVKPPKNVGFREGKIWLNIIQLMDRLSWQAWTPAIHKIEIFFFTLSDAF